MSVDVVAGMALLGVVVSQAVSYGWASRLVSDRRRLEQVICDRNPDVAARCDGVAVFWSCKGILALWSLPGLVIPDRGDPIQATLCTPWGPKPIPAEGWRRRWASHKTVLVNSQSRYHVSTFARCGADLVEILRLVLVDDDEDPDRTRAG